jgi:hypothetical protein
MEGGELIILLIRFSTFYPPPLSNHKSLLLRRNPTIMPTSHSSQAHPDAAPNRQNRSHQRCFQPSPTQSNRRSQPTQHKWSQGNAGSQGDTSHPTQPYNEAQSERIRVEISRYWLQLDYNDQRTQRQFSTRASSLLTTSSSSSFMLQHWVMEPQFEQPWNALGSVNARCYTSTTGGEEQHENSAGGNGANDESIEIQRGRWSLEAEASSFADDDGVGEKRAFNRRSSRE